MFVSHLKQYATTQTYHKKHKFSSMQDGLPDGLIFLITSIMVCIVSYALTLQFLKHCISCKHGAALLSRKEISIFQSSLCFIWPQTHKYCSNNLLAVQFTVCTRKPVY